MKQLWHKGKKINKEILAFTVGNDHKCDQQMLEHDVYGTIAHAAMLKKIRILRKSEFQRIRVALVASLMLWRKGKFIVTQEQEDCHTAIEHYLVKKLGNLGKKVHTGRSRNDQVVTMTRLYSKKTILEHYAETLKLVGHFIDLAKKYEFVPMPGYTHMQRAMPSSAGMWFGQYAEALLDDLEFLDEAYEYNDMCPLGSAAGFGVNLPIDRLYTAKLLGFARVQRNAMYVSYSRGKVETAIIFSLTQLMGTLAKFANDTLMFSMAETGFVELPEEFCTGSSLMPQKRNGDVFELVRGKSKLMVGNLIAAIDLQSHLLSGYNRDSQLSKDLIVRSFELYREAVRILNLVVPRLRMNIKKCSEACTPEIFATDHAIRLVQEGIPFRDAYARVAASLVELETVDPVKNIKQKRHIGATGNLQLPKTNQALQSQRRWLAEEQRHWKKVISRLMTLK